MIFVYFNYSAFKDPSIAHKEQQQQFEVSDDSIIDRSGYLSMGAAMRHCQLQWRSIFQEHFTISLTQFSDTKQ